jgi:long-chain acyl-CoA synthetase
VNVANLLAGDAMSHGDAPALRFEDRTYSYKELEELTCRFASMLVARQVPKGGVVAIYLESGPELVIAYLGALKAGAVPNVVNAFLKPGEACVIVADSQALILVTDCARWSSLAAVRAGLGIREAFVTGADQLIEGASSLENCLQAASTHFEAIDLSPSALASLLYTSGTTGTGKGVMLTHLNILDNAEQFGRIHYLPEDVVLIAAPLFHCWGLINGVLAIFAKRGTAVIVRRFQTEPVLDLIEAERPSVMMGVPTMFNFMAKSPTISGRNLSSLRTILSAAAPMPLELIETVRKKWGVGYAESYGLTETSPVITTTSFKEMRPGSCGRAMGDTELKVVSPDGETLPAGSTGELWARGTAISAGYFRRPEATAAVFAEDGWFKTGDIVRIDENGYVHIVDRLKDMINVAGEKVYPRDVEELLHRHPAVADAVIVGIPDAERGEVVKAVIVLKTGCRLSCEEVVEYLRPSLASFKLPRAVEFVESIPRSPSGKALKRLLR